MRERIDIVVGEEALDLNEANKERLARTLHRELTDRAPVIVDATFWTILAARGVTFAQFAADPRSHLRESLLNYKWRCENVRDDAPLDLARVTLQPDFGALRGSEFPLEIEWQEDQPAKTHPFLYAPEEIDTLELPDPAGGLNARRIAFFHAMRDMAGEFDVRLNGQPLDINVTLSHPGGPFPSAFAVCGANLLLWMKTDAGRIHRLLDLTTRSHIQCIALMNKLAGAAPFGPIWTGADTAEMMSRADFREFVVPYYRRLWESYAPPRSLHMCGKINHLVTTLRDDLAIDHLEGFGFPADRELLSREWAGRITMRGGPHPQLLKDGPVEVVIAECESYLRTAGRCGGYILSEGFGLAPGTPPAHIDAMVEASRRVGTWTGQVD